jgi:hypothetical protein
MVEENPPMMPPPYRWCYLACWLCLAALAALAWR